MLEDIGIKYTYGNSAETGDYVLKQETEDFVVQEIVGGSTCRYGPVIDMEKYRMAEHAYDGIPESVPKERRKAIYDSVRHFPFKRLRAVNNAFVKEEGSTDIYACTVMKWELNTQDAACILAKRLGVAAQCVQCGGNKDKRGVTFQEISINCAFEPLFNYALSLSTSEGYRDAEYGYAEAYEEENKRAAEELGRHMAVERYETNDRMRIFNIRKGSSKQMGDVTGNRFTIRIRGLHGIKEAPAYFLNYFGPQRFGKDFNNHAIGRLILEKEYDAALDIIAGSSIPDDERETRGSFVQKFIARMRAKKMDARVIVYRMDRLTRMMYMHAYQSYEFNCALNQRWEAKKFQAGDKVLCEGPGAEIDVAQAEVGGLKDDMEGLEGEIAGTQALAKGLEDEILGVTQNREVHDAPNGACDAAPPRASPKGAKETAEDLLYAEPEEDAALETIYIPLVKKNDKFLKGGYRKMIEEIDDFSYRKEEGAVVVKFSLGRSCYATSALREIVGDAILKMN